MRELSRSEVELELSEQRRDLHAFSEAFDLIESRCFEAQDARFHPILEWQGADASLFTLKACVEKILGVIGEYEGILRDMDRGEIVDTDGGQLRLVKMEET
jgi:hypothetical protein